MDCSDEEIMYIDSEEENLLSDDEDREPDSYDGLAEDDNQMKRSQKSYVVLKEGDIRKHQRDDIEQVSSFLSLSQVEAIALLIHYRWSVSKVLEDEWYKDEENIRKTVGILKEPVVDFNAQKEIQCGICFESYTGGEIESVSCGHPFCNTCWTFYITIKIEGGSGCLRVVCPEPSCSAVVCQDLIDKIVKKEHKEKYYTYFLRSYVEEGKKFKWCPSPGCEYAVDFGGSYDVSCLCSFRFCWNCCEDAHSPVDCDMVSKWLLKNRDESENTNWILAKTKPCPKCKRPIEKNLGCNHMTCSAPCRFSFCWTCLEPWEGHRACNVFKEDTEGETKRKRAQDALDRYQHYYERWEFNTSSRLKAISDLEKWQSVQLKELSAILDTPETQLQFTVEAWLQGLNDEPDKRHFFEYLQGEAETGLDRLHHCAEEKMKQFICKTEDPPKDFIEFQVKLTGLTVTKTYFENLVKALENGLADVVYSKTKPTEESGLTLYDQSGLTLYDQSGLTLYDQLIFSQFSRDENLDDYSDVV